MRILWVSPNGGMYKSNETKGTGGWIVALQNALVLTNEIELGIAFFHPQDSEVLVEDKITYFPIRYNEGGNLLKKWLIRNFRNEEKYLKCRIADLVHGIKSFQPDVIHIWGIENKYSLVINEIDNIPIVVHIQGIASAIDFAYIPPLSSRFNIKCIDSWIDRVLFKKGYFAAYQEFRKKVIYEKNVAPHVKYWIGRTEWDKIVSHMLSPDSYYFHCEELMRSDFSNHKWRYHHDGETIVIHSSISRNTYKGIDIILKTAKILHDIGSKIEWNVYGCPANDKLTKYISSQLQIEPESVNVIMHGRVNGDTIKNGLLKSDCYVHPSYIENSSNAIAEAQLLGVPVIAQYVGGNPSMLRDDSGILVAPNEPYILADAILKCINPSIAMHYSNKSIKLSEIRQDEKY